MSKYKMLFITKEIGFEIRVNGAYFKIKDIIPYERKSDGFQSCLIFWETACRECGARREFKTGGQQGEFHPTCLDCTKVKQVEIDVKRKRNKEVKFVPEPKDIWEGFSSLPKDTRMSVVNRTREIYTPGYVLGKVKNLEFFSDAELLEGTLRAIEEGWLFQTEIGRRSCGHPILGIRARSRGWLEETGLLQPVPSVFS